MLVETSALQPIDRVRIRTTPLAHELDRRVGTDHANVMDRLVPVQGRKPAAQKSMKEVGDYLGYRAARVTATSR